MPDVGIVMPVYNQVPEYLEIALRSVLGQAYRDFLFVIVIDGADQLTQDIIRKETKNDERVHIISKVKNEGVSKALNTGFSYLMMQPVEFLTWVSSDNYYYPTFLEELRNVLVSADEPIGFAYSSFRHVDKDGNPVKSIVLSEFLKYQDQPKENLLDECFVGVSFMYRKKYAQMIEGYYLEPVEDYDYWLRLMEVCDLIYVPKVLMDYRMESPKSISHQLKSVDRQRGWRYAFNLTKHQARKRRKIPFELTIFFPINHISESLIQHYEKLLDQHYSNYKLIVIDLTSDGAAKNVLQHISDPRVTFVTFPNPEKLYSIKQCFHFADTPFTLLFDQGIFPSNASVLGNMVKFMKQLQEKNNMDNISVADGNYGRVELKAAGEKIAFNQLYQTQLLFNNIQLQ